MTTTQVLLFFLLGSPFFSIASPHGNTYETVVQIEKDVPIKCPEGFVIDGTLTRCLRVATGYEDTCEESKQCSEFLSAGATCQDGQCLCLDGYHYLHGQCHKSKGLFESCEKDADCFVNAEYNAVACINNRCKCRDGFYQREYSTCRRKARGINGECLINSDCAFQEGAICFNQKCTLSEQANIEEVQSYDHNNLERLGTIESIKAGVPPILVGHDCEETTDCGSIPNAYCGADKKCTCLRAHFASDELTTCIPEIGEKCTDKDELHVENAVCKDGQWTCIFDHTASKNNRLCNEVKYYNDKCKSNEMCQLLGPRATCQDKYCQCDSTSHWLPNEVFCWITKNLEEECQSNNDCIGIGNSVTPICQKKGSEKLCSCPSKSHIGKSGEDKACVLNQTELGSYCTENSDCKVSHSTCQINKCECEDNYFESGKSCLAGLNAVCEKDSDCKQSNTVCLQGKAGATCQCVDNFVATPEKNCINKSAFNETCSCNLQCSSVTYNALCMTNETSLPEDNCGASKVGTCKCTEGDYYRDGTCFKKKKLGEVCTKEGECFTKSGSEHAVCKNGICSCDFEYKRDGDNCIPENYANSITLSLWMILLLAVSVY